MKGREIKPEWVFWFGFVISPLFSRLRAITMEPILPFMRNQAQNAEVPNTMIFYRRGGDKVCKLDWAAFSAIQDESKVELLFYVRGQHGEHGNLVSAEVSLFVEYFDLDVLVGKRFEVPSTYDNQLDDYVSAVYYWHYKDFNNIFLEVLARKGDSFHVRWSGTTEDIDSYSGREPENRVVIEAIFEFKETLEATYNHPMIEPKKRPEILKQKNEQEVSPDQLQLFGDAN